MMHFVSDSAKARLHLLPALARTRTSRTSRKWKGSGSEGRDGRSCSAAKRERSGGSKGFPLSKHMWGTCDSHATTLHKHTTGLAPANPKLLPRSLRALAQAARTPCKSAEQRKPPKARLNQGGMAPGRCQTALAAVWPLQAQGGSASQALFMP